MTEAIVYIRYSSKRQEKGFSRERQEEDCRAFCEKMGWTVVRTVMDLGVSAYSGNHIKDGNLGKLTKEVHDGLHHGRVIVAEKLDRFSRMKPSVTRRWVEDTTDGGVNIATVANSKIYSVANRDSSMMDDMELMMTAYLAHKESQQKADRVDDAKRRAFERAERREGAWIITAHCPGWLKPNAARNDWIRDEHREQIVRDIYEMSAAGHGSPHIAAALNARPDAPAWGHWRKLSKPKWDTTFVRAILEHPAVEGDYVVGAISKKKNRPKQQGKIVGYFPRIVDADLVARAREAVKNRKITRGRVGDGVANLFSNKMRCAECGSVCHVGWSTRGARYVRCDAAARNRGCTNRTNFNYTAFEKAALDAILHLALDDRFFSSTGEVGKLTTELAEVTKALSDKAEQKQRMLKLFQMDQLGQDADIAAIIGSLTQDVESLQGREASIREALVKANGRVSSQQHLARVHNIRTAVSDPDEDVRRDARQRVQAAIRSIVSSVELDPADAYCKPPKKTLTLILMAGVMAIKFNNDGKILDAVTRGLEPSAAEGGAAISDLLRRLVA